MIADYLRRATSRELRTRAEELSTTLQRGFNLWGEPLDPVQRAQLKADLWAVCDELIARDSE